MKKEKNKKAKAFSIIRLIALLIVIVLGFGSYFYYFSHIQNRLSGALLFSQTIYSTLRLFGASFDISYADALEIAHAKLVLSCVEIARWIAIFLTGNILFKMMSPFLSRIIIRIRRGIWQRKDNRILIVGNNKENKSIYKSVERKDKCLLLVPKTDDFNELSKQDIKAIMAKVTDTSNEIDTANTFASFINKTLSNAIESNKKCTIIINTQNDEINLHICHQAALIMKNYLSDFQSTINNGSASDEAKTQSKDKIINALGKLRIIVFGKREHEAIYLQLQNESFGIIKYYNKYRLTAFDFIAENPLTESFTEELQDKYIDNACVSEKLDFNVLLVGFGETNQEIFKVSVTNNQYIEKADNSIPQLKKVNYHIFDKSDDMVDKSLNRTVFRYEDEFLESVSSEKNADDYFPLAKTPALVKTHKLDVNSNSFFKTVKAICTSNPDSVNQIIIAFSNDLEDIEIAQKLVERKHEWNADNISIFVKVRNDLPCGIINNARTFDFKTFGNEEMLVFNYKKIMRNSVENLAIQRHAMYNYEGNRKDGRKVSIEENNIDSRYNWHTSLGNTRRESNIFNILSLRMKMQLLGLDFTKSALPENCGDIVKTNDEYFSVYAKDNLPKIEIPIENAANKDIYSYESIKQEDDFKTNNIRNNLTVQEHYHWNAFMMCQGFIPMKKSVTSAKFTKDYNNRLHSNLCSFEGLFDFRRYISSISGCTEESADVIKYDYQLMDDAWWFLNSEGYTVYKRWK